MSTSTTPSIAKRSKTPSTAQPSSIRTRSMSSTTLVNRRGSLPAVKGRRALDLKTINRRYDEDDGDQVAESSKKVVCRGGEKVEGAERPTKQARKKSPVKSKGKGKERMKEILGEDAEMGGAASEEDLPEEQKPARFLPIPPRSPVDGHHPSSSTLSNPFQPHGASALPRSSSKYNDIHMGSDDSYSSSDDSMLLMPSPRKVAASPLKPSSLSISTVPSSGVKRSRFHAFEDSPRATSPRKFVPPKTPTIDMANPFYVSPAPKPLPPSLSLASASTSTSSMAATSVVSSPITSSISTTINSLSIRTPQSQRKRAREVFSGSHNSPEDTSAPAPIKSCLSSSSSSGSSPASAKSSDGDGSSPRKRVHFTSPPPPSQTNDDGPSTTASSSSSSLASKSLDPPSSPPSALNPPMIDIVALTKRKLKSPRKRVMPKPTDGSTLMVRDGAKAVKKLEGLTVPKPFVFGAVRSLSSISSGLSSVAEGKEREKEESSTTKAKGNSLMGPPALPLPRAFGAYASGSASMVPPPKRIPSSGGMSSSGSRTNLNVLSQSTSSSSSRIPQAPSLSSSINSRPPPSKPSLPTSRSVSSLSSLSNPKRAPIPSSSAIPTISSLSSSTSSRTSKYPSSLGSRPPPSKDRPQSTTARKTSVPVPASAMQLPKPPPRAVSDPVASLTASAGPSRIARGVATAASSVDRKGLSSESRSAMAGLAESLAKMQVRKAAAGVAAAGGGEKRLSASSTMPNLAELAQAGPSTTTNKVRSTAGGRPSFPSSSSSSRVMAPPPNPPSSFQSGIPTSTSNRRLSSNLPTSSSNRRESSSSSEGDLSFTGGVSLTSSKSTGSVGTLAHQVDKDGARALSGVVAFVDVRTAEGDEAGGMFVEILRGLGAKVLVRPSDSVTHIIFKAGKSSTLAHYRKFVPAGPAPLAGEEMMALEDLVDLDGLGEESGPSYSGKAPIHMVGIGWVIRCKEEKKRVSEFEYKVDVAEQSNFQKRRKSMEPKQMRAMLGAPAGTTMADSVEKARRRSLLFAPRISSPLKRAYVSAPAESEDEGDDSNMLA